MVIHCFSTSHQWHLQVVVHRGAAEDELEADQLCAQTVDGSVPAMRSSTPHLISLPFGMPDHASYLPAILHPSTTWCCCFRSLRWEQCCKTLGPTPRNICTTWLAGLQPTPILESGGGRWRISICPHWRTISASASIWDWSGRKTLRSVGRRSILPSISRFSPVWCHTESFRWCHVFYTLVILMLRYAASLVLTPGAKSVRYSMQWTWPSKPTLPHHNMSPLMRVWLVWRIVSPTSSICRINDTHDSASRSLNFVTLWVGMWFTLRYMLGRISRYRVMRGKRMVLWWSWCASQTSSTKATTYSRTTFTLSQFSPKHYLMPRPCSPEQFVLIRKASLLYQPRWTLAKHRTSARIRSFSVHSEKRNHSVNQCYCWAQVRRLAWPKFALVPASSSGSHAALRLTTATWVVSTSVIERFTTSPQKGHRRGIGRKSSSISLTWPCWMRMNCIASTQMLLNAKIATISLLRWLRVCAHPMMSLLRSRFLPWSTGWSTFQESKSETACYALIGRGASESEAPTGALVVVMAFIRSASIGWPTRGHVNELWRYVNATILLDWQLLLYISPLLHTLLHSLLSHS